MKKLLALLLALAMCLAMFACGETEDKKDKDKDEEVEEEIAELEEELEELEAELEEAEEDEDEELIEELEEEIEKIEKKIEKLKDGDKDEDEEDEETKDEDEKETKPVETKPAKPVETKPAKPVEVEPTTEFPEFDEVIIIDDTNCTVKIVSMGYDELWEVPIINASIVNKTDKTLEFDLNLTKINGVFNGSSSGGAFETETVAAGESAEGTIRVFGTTDLNSYGINKYTDLEIKAELTPDGEYTPISTGVANVYPYGKAAATKFSYTTDANDAVLIDNEFVKVIATDYVAEGSYCYMFKFYVENKTDKYLNVLIDGYNIDGTEDDGLSYITIADDTVIFEDKYFFTDEIDEAVLSGAKSIKMNIKVTEQESWNTLAEGEVTYNIK